MEFKIAYMGKQLYGDPRVIGMGSTFGGLKRTVTMTNVKQGTEFTFKDGKLENTLYDDEYVLDANFKELLIRSDDGTVSLKLDT